MADIHKLIAAISPDIYCDPEVRSKIKKLVKEKGYQEAAESKEIKLVSQKEFNLEEAKLKPFDKYGIKSPFERHKLKYDSPSESLEPLYFWILDFVNATFKEVEKVTDNFVAAPGSGYFSELGQKATAMQEKAMSMLGTVNTVLKSILNILYDLKEFKLRLELYDKLESKNSEERRSGLYSLKQIWMDSVDIKRGTTSLKGLVQQFDYVTIIDAFMAAESLAEVSKLDLNDRVKRILEQRVGEFFKWVEISKVELKKRFEIEQRYLRSQYNTIQLYSRWIKPYLKAANLLEQNAKPNAGLVTAFNTMLLELTILARDPYDLDDDISKKQLPEVFKNVKKRKYYATVVIEFAFRGIPQKVGQGYSYGGKTEVTFSAYALNEQEIEVLRKELEKNNFGEILGLIEGATKESLEQIKADIDEFLGDKKEKKKDEKNEDDTNPFSALWSFFKSDTKKDEKEDLSKGIKPDNEYESVMRSQTVIEAIDKCRGIFDTYKKAHQMPAFP